MRVQDNQKLAREAVPQTALHPMEGKCIRRHFPAQLQDRHGAGRAKEWELQGEQAAQDKSHCFLHALRTCHTSRLCSLLVSACGEQETKFPQDAVRSFSK